MAIRLGMIQRSGETSLIQSLPTPLSNGPVDRSGDVPPTDQPQASWKRWAVCIFPAASTLVSAAFTLSAISSGCFVAAAVFGVLTVMSADCAVNACSPHNTLSTNPSTFSRGIDRLSHLLSCLSESTSNIVYNQGYEVVDVPAMATVFSMLPLCHPCNAPAGMLTAYVNRCMKKQENGYRITKTIIHVSMKTKAAGLLCRKKTFTSI